MEQNKANAWIETRRMLDLLGVRYKTRKRSFVFVGSDVYYPTTGTLVSSGKFRTKYEKGISGLLRYLLEHGKVLPEKEGLVCAMILQETRKN